MASPLRFEAEAERELDDAALTYDEQRPGLGRRFLNEVAVTTERIRQFPGAGPPVKHVPADLGVRQASVKGFCCPGRSCCSRADFAAPHAPARSGRHEHRVQGIVFRTTRNTRNAESTRATPPASRNCHARSGEIFP